MTSSKDLRRASIPGDNSCLFSCIQYIIYNGCYDLAQNIHFRRMVASYITHNTNIHYYVTQPIPVYCDWIQNEKHWGGELEIYVLSKIFSVQFRVIDMSKTEKKIISYGEKLYTECAYLYYNGTHYEPCYSPNENDDNNVKQTKFSSDDPKIVELAKSLIKVECLKKCLEECLNDDHEDVMGEPESENNVHHDQQIEEEKRMELEKKNSCTKLGILTCETSLQHDIVLDILPTINVQLDRNNIHVTGDHGSLPNDVCMVSKITLPLPHEFGENKDSAAEPIATVKHTGDRLQLVEFLQEEYRGYYKTQYKPKNRPRKEPKCGTKQMHCVTYMKDKNGKTLKLRFPPNFLYKYDTIVVERLTVEIDGQHYYSPHVFQETNSESEPVYANTIYIPLSSEKLIVELELPLVAIMLKQDELITCQPLKPYRPTGKENLAETYRYPNDFIQKYQLNQSQIAFTLGKRIGNNSYDIFCDTTCLSNIITQEENKQ
ncbi:unnamed protein product [Didymodactylos carnosus]|uniref:Ubiquitin thioesterase OTU n=1 Tax=Didymodactylos carnosus TaxID=1234261 RepID=A0A814DI52_9BILA|nr:unnamed protein product [Didymodactylos carnosus]CAF1324760.1 unnamed protein product [Didymodactylos carnosus]CAF3732257.1 unnamed protein product [Didymodactylos carnosus]CAF4135504.1 unnamed protein product [Didymodactylos carnosus]